MYIPTCFRYVSNVIMLILTFQLMGDKYCQRKIGGQSGSVGEGIPSLKAALGTQKSS